MKIQNYVELIEKSAKSRRRILARGKPGCGKTQGAKQAAERLEMEFICSPLALYDPSVIQGYPVRENGQAGHVLYGDVYKVFHAVKPTIWWLADMGQAGETTLKAVMRIIENGEHMGKRLPDCVTVGGDTNDVSHGAGVYGMIEPLKDRFHTIIEVETDLDQVISYGLSNNWDTAVLAYLRNAPEALHDWKPEKSMKSGGATPRGWEYVSEWLAMGVDDREVICGKVGDGRGTQFLAFREMMNELPDINMVMMQPDTAPVPTNPSAQWLISMAVASKINNKTFGQGLKYLTRLPQMFRAGALLDAMRAEDVSRASKRLPKDYKPISSSRDFTAWAVSKDGKEIQEGGK